ncbi:ankyrin repeat domain-containing protein [Pokkaliibacter sp. CJK22405]|uniref:ankyrin repeat domain-containing protein n=1 Tax=Pokkaliibacter sp. CJK22405 TaxID=3384615 RepID=UPI003985056F
MRDIKRAIVILLAFVVLMFSVLCYYLSSLSLAEQITYADTSTNSYPISWLTVEILSHGTPSETEINFLNHQAAARWIAALPDVALSQQIMQHLQASGLDIDSHEQLTGTGWTALHAAAVGEETETVRRLLNFGADPDVPDINGLTPLDLITQIQQEHPERHYRLIQQMLEAAAEQQHSFP